VTLRARWVTRRARWVTLRARWVTRRARWVTLRAPPDPIPTDSYTRSVDSNCLHVYRRTTEVPINPVPPPSQPPGQTNSRGPTFCMQVTAPLAAALHDHLRGSWGQVRVPSAT
jgi:hypothetical protein